MLLVIPFDRIYLSQLTITIVLWKIKNLNGCMPTW